MTQASYADLLRAVISNEAIMKFRKKGSKGSASKKAGHSSPMQKKDWAKDMTSVEEAVAFLVTHVEKGAAWSGNDLVYLNALWDAVEVVARKRGYSESE